MAAALAWSVWIITAEADRRAVSEVELSIEQGRLPERQRAAGFAALDGRSDDCRREFRRAAVALAVSEAERAGAPGASAGAIKAIRDHLACSPSQSNAWLLLAMYEQKAGAPWEQVLKGVETSYRTGPSEAWIAERRLRFLCDAPGGLPKALESEAMSDFNGLLEAKRAEAVADAYRACGPADRKRFDEAIAGASPAARAAYARWVASRR